MEIGFAREIRMLDGGFGAEAQRHSQIEGNPLWSSRLLKENPDLVKRIHKSFLEAGAEVICTNTYQCDLDLIIAEYNLSSICEAQKIMRRGVELAIEARDEFCAQSQEKSARKSNQKYPLVAASLGSYGVLLPCPAEFTGNYPDEITASKLTAWHFSRLNALLSATPDNETGKKPECRPDLIAFETVSSRLELDAIFAAIDQLASQSCCGYSEFPPFWFSFASLDGVHIGNPARTEKLRDVAASITPHLSCPVKSKLIGCGFNCAIPVNCVRLGLDNFFAGFEEKDARRLARIAYPNDGFIWHGVMDEGGYKDPNITVETAQQHWLTAQQQCLQEFVETNGKSGANWLGGCCRIGPEVLSKLYPIIEQIRNATKQ